MSHFINKLRKSESGFTQIKSEYNWFNSTSEENFTIPKNEVFQS